MLPIILDEFGLTLIPRENDGTLWRKNFLGKHDGCSQAGDLVIGRYSSAWNAVACAHCHTVRLMIPASVFPNALPQMVPEDMWEALRTWCAQEIQKKTDRGPSVSRDTISVTGGRLGWPHY